MTKDNMAHNDDQKIDTDKAWIRVKQIGPIVICTAAVVTLYFGIKSDISTKHVEAMRVINEVVSQLDKKVDRDKLQNETLVKAVDQVRDELRRLTVDGVSVRRFEAWLEIVKARNPTLNFPDLPR